MFSEHGQFSIKTGLDRAGKVDSNLSFQGENHPEKGDGVEEQDSGTSETGETGRMPAGAAKTARTGQIAKSLSPTGLLSAGTFPSNSSSSNVLSPMASYRNARGFLGICTFSILAFTVLLIAMPAYLELPLSLPVATTMAIGLALAAMLMVTGYGLLVQNRNLQKQETTILEQQKLIATMAGQIETLKDRQNNLRKAHREEKLRAEEAQNSKAAFLAHLSHDIRTPLNHIIGFADLICHQAFGPLGDERYLGYARDIKQSGEGLLRGISGILELSELQAGSRILNSEKIIISDLLNHVRNKFSDRAKRCGISLDVECCCETVMFGDRAAIERIMANLLDNAVRFTAAGGQVRVGAWLNDEGVVLEVSDTGIGMAKEKLASLFEPFSPGDASRSRDRQGMGMGLPIARAIAELWGGELAVDSMAGIGTTVAVSLPSKVADICPDTRAA